jgi:hypothetical protein
MAGPKSSSHPICAATSLELRPAAYFRASLTSQLEIRATVRVQDIRDTGHNMKRFLFLPALVMLALTSTATTPVRAGGSDVAAGLIGGLAAGTIIGAAVTAPRYYGPPPVYVAPAPYCYWTRGEPVWDGYRGVWTYPAVRVCE